METDKTLQEVIAGYFKPNDFVRVINIDTEPFEWNYCADEEIFQDQIYRRVIKRKIDTYRLEPGESQVLEGACATIMVAALFKKVAPKKEKLGHKALGINAIQRQYLDEIIVGTENPFAKPVSDTRVSDTPSQTTPAKNDIESEFEDAVEKTVEAAKQPAKK
jgi:hypothetical protein